MQNIYKKIVLTFLAIFFILSYSTSCFAFGPSSDRIYQGIDVSRWQEDIDFSLVKKST